MVGDRTTTGARTTNDGGDGETLADYLQTRFEDNRGMELYHVDRGESLGIVANVKSGGVTFRTRNKPAYHDYGALYRALKAGFRFIEPREKLRFDGSSVP